MIKKWQGHKGEALDTKYSFDVIDCEKCAYKHIVPIPKDEELIKVYEDEYYSESKPLYIERMKEDLEWWNLSYDDRYDSFEELLEKDRRTILDIGSGPGLFLNRGKERGWEVTGVEPSKLAFEYSSKKLGLNIYNMFLDEETKKDIDLFDVIHMSEVLEHIPKPKGLLNIAYEKLTPGGLICVVVPNDYNPFQIVLQDACEYDPWWVTPPHHVNYFNFYSLKLLLEKVGFSVVLKESTFPIDMFLLMGKNYVGNDSLGRECHQMRKNLELNLNRAGNNHLKRNLYKLMAKSGLGREIIMIGQKK
jgi:SAM-dependent methyltransferase